MKPVTDVLLSRKFASLPGIVQFKQLSLWAVIVLSRSYKSLGSIKLTSRTNIDEAL